MSFCCYIKCWCTLVTALCAVLASVLSVKDTVVHLEEGSPSHEGVEQLPGEESLEGLGLFC